MELRRGGVRGRRSVDRYQQLDTGEALVVKDADEGDSCRHVLCTASCGITSCINIPPTFVGMCD